MSDVIEKLIDGLDALSGIDSPRSKAWEIEAVAAMQQASRTLKALQSAPVVDIAEATEIIRIADRVIVWEHHPAPHGFQERIEAFLGIGGTIQPERTGS